MPRMNSSNRKKQRFGWQRADADGREDTQKQRNGSKKNKQTNHKTTHFPIIEDMGANATLYF